MIPVQPGILAPVPAHGRYLVFSLKPFSSGSLSACSTEALPTVLKDFGSVVNGSDIVAGFGQSLIKALGKDVDGMTGFPQFATSAIDVPSTPASLWCWIRGEDPGKLLHKSRQIQAVLQGVFETVSVVPAFRFGTGRDLTGYEDGTENPEGGAAIKAAVINGEGDGLNGSSFAAVQLWQHNLDQFQKMSLEEQDHTIGRRISDNEELGDAPPTAHVKRTAQESFKPEAFMVRRSMPWADPHGEGLMFVCFVRRLEQFEVQLKRMTGMEDGIQDALFRFTRPTTGNYFWCPPVRKTDDGISLNLSLLGID